jgi:hypothetical protein
MALWDKLKDGIDRVEKVATDALDEGKSRLEARRARQAAEQAAGALGWATYRAWEAGRPLDTDTLDRLARALRDHEQEARRREEAAGTAAEWRRTGDPDAGAPAAGAPDAGAPAAGAPDAGAPATGAPATGAPDADAATPPTA